MKVFGHLTKTDISTGHNVPHTTGQNGDFSTKEYKYPFLNKTFFLKFLHNILIIFTQFLVKNF